MKNRLKRILKECILCGGDLKVLRTTKPCDACRAKYLTKGVMLVEYETLWEDGKAVERLTGNFSVVDDDLFEEMSGREVPKYKTILVKPGLIEMIVRNAE
jgi:hypothetical protein